MRKSYTLPLILLIFSIIASSCRSEFETVRQSGDGERILEKAYEYYEEEDYLKAKTLFELVLDVYRGTNEAEKMYYTFAYTHYKMNQYILASYYFENFASTYPTSEFREESEFMSAYCHYLISPTFRLEQSSTLTAIEGFQQFTNLFPNSERVPECNRLIDELRDKLERKVYEEAMLYYQLSNYQSALHSFENLLHDYPDSDKAEEVRFLLVKSAFLLAENSIYERKLERYEATVKKITEFRKKHKISSYDKELQEMNAKSLIEIKKLNND